MTFRVLLLCFFLCPTCIVGQFISPCPSLFSYDNIGGNSWTGTLQPRINEEHNGIWLTAVFDRPFDMLESDFGESVQRGPNKYLIKKRITVPAETTLQIKITASNNPVLGAPKLLGYLINGKTVCPEQGEIPDPPPPESFLPASGNELVSPCPGLFTYEPLAAGANRWYGQINVRSDAALSGVWMKMILDKPPVDFGTEFGEAVQKEPNEFLIKNRNNAVSAGEVIQFRVYADFIPGEAPPKLLGYRLNGQTVCPVNFNTEKPKGNELVSPCPELFMYEPPGVEPDRWYGVINLKTDKELSGVWLRVYLDRPSIQLGNWFGIVKTNDSENVYRIQRRDFKLTPGAVVPLRFYIRYNPVEPVPKLEEIRLNGINICKSSGSISNHGGFPAPSPVQQQPNWLPTTPTPSSAGGRPLLKPDWGGAWKPPVAAESVFAECGIVATKPLPLVSGGALTKAGQWPWHGALYQVGGGEYFCGAALVSLRHALTAAHCATIPKTPDTIDPNQVELVLGKHLRSVNNGAVQRMQISRLTLHPDYDFNNYANDIALIHLSRTAEYSEYVRPVCLWTENTDLSTVENREGTVVGWGYDSTGKVTDELLKAVMPVATHKKCIWSNKEFYRRVLNDRNFCAGFRNGTSVCTGDSGGGLVFPTPGTNSRWQIRGLVSLSVALQDSSSKCDTSHYVVFTDVAKFLPWIQQAINTG